MLVFIIRRLMQSVVVLFVMSLLVFPASLPSAILSTS